MVRVNKPPRPSTLTIWWTAARPHTLTASLCPCLVAYAANHPPAHLQLAWTIFCSTVQLGTNLHNDYADFIRGADRDDRVGHARATAKGWLTPSQTLLAATSVLTVTLCAGIYLIVTTQQQGNIFLWLLILSSIFNAFAYTGGPFPLGYLGLGDWSIAYSGLGDVFVWLYFGLVATLMVPYLMHLQGRPVDWKSQWRYAFMVGCLATNILVVNNLRDRHTDVAANKRTTAVRFGRVFSLVEYILCLAVSYGLCLWNAVELGNYWLLLPWFSLVVAIREAQAVWKSEGEALNAHVGGAAKVQVLFCVGLAVGIQCSTLLRGAGYQNRS